MTLLFLAAMGGARITVTVILRAFTVLDTTPRLTRRNTSPVLARCATTPVLTRLHTTPVLTEVA